MARTKDSMKRKARSNNAENSTVQHLLTVTPNQYQSTNDKKKAKELLNNMVNGAIHYLNDENPLFFVKKSNGNIVSALMLKRNTPVHGVVLIALIATKEAYQRSGLSSILMNEAIKWAKNQNFSHIFSEPKSRKFEMLLKKLKFITINFKYGLNVRNGKLIKNKFINNILTLKADTRIAPYARVMKIKPNEPSARPTYAHATIQQNTLDA